MTKQIINIGTSANKGNGDPLRTAFTKVNANFDDLYAAIGTGITAGTTAPVGPIVGDLWYDTNSGRTYIYYDSSWIDSNPPTTSVISSLVNGTKTVSLGTDGSLSISGDIKSNGNINININLIDSTMRRWQFGEDGLLTFPDGTNQSTAWTGSTAVSSLVNSTKTVSLDANGVLTLPNSGEIFDYAGGAGTLGIFISRTFQTPDNTNASNFGTNTLKLLLSDTEATEIGDYLSAGIGVRVWFTVGDSYPITSCVQVSAGIWTITATGMGNRFATFTVTNPLIFIYTGSTPNNYTNFAQYEPAGAGAAVVVSKGGNSWYFDNTGDLNLPPSGTIRDSMTGDSLLNPTKLINGAHELVLNVNGAGPWLSFPVSGGQQIQIQGTDIVGIGSFSPSIMSPENGVVISANSTAQNGPRRDWNFGPEGKLTLPGGTTYEYVNAPLTGHGDGLARLDFTLVTDGVNAQWAAASASPAGSGYSPGDTFTFNTEFLGIPGASVTIEVLTVGPGGSVENLGFTQPPFYPADIYRDSPINLQVGAESNRWTFGATGNTTFPTGLVLGAPRGVGTVSFTSAIDKEFQIETGTSTTSKLWRFGTDGKLTAPGNLQVNGGKIILNTGGNAYVESVDYGVNSANSAVNIFGGPYQKIKLRAGFGTEATWTFATDGTLSLPATGKIASGVNTAQAGSSKRISFTDGGQGNYFAYGPTVLAVDYTDNVDILTKFAAGSTITFTNGDVRTITAITGVPGEDYIDIAWTGAIADYLTIPAFPITLKTADFAAATTAPQWQFGTTGTLTLPNTAVIRQSTNAEVTAAQTAYNAAVASWENTRKNDYVYSINNTPNLSFTGWAFATWDDVSGTTASAYLAIINNAMIIQNSAPSSPPTPLVFTPALSASLALQIKAGLLLVINTYAAWQALLTSVDIVAGSETLSLLTNNKIQVPGIIQTDVEEDIIIRTRYLSASSMGGDPFDTVKDFVFSTNGSLTFQRAAGVTTGNAVVQGDTSGNLNLTGGNYVNIESNSYAAITLAKYVANTSVDMGNATSPVRAFGNLQIMSGRTLTFADSTVQSTAYVKTTGTWTVTTGTNNYSFTVPANGAYQLWVRGNIPNGIISYIATVHVTNPNVPVLGTQRAWNYTGAGDPILLTSMPSQIIGTEGTISTGAISGTTNNVFVFGISNTSGSNQTVSWGYVSL